MGGPTADMTWEGEQLAVWCDRSATGTYDDYVTERKLRDLAREMAPRRFEPPHRVAYAWQVAVFDPAEHVVIRYWCREHNVSIVDFWRGFYPQHKDELTVQPRKPPTPSSRRSIYWVGNDAMALWRAR